MRQHQTKQNTYFVGLWPVCVGYQQGREALIFETNQRNKMTEVLLR